MFARTYADVFRGDEAWSKIRVPERRALRVGPEVDLRAGAAVLRRDAARAGADRGHRRRALPRPGRRLGDDRPHLAGRLDHAGQRRRARYLIEHGVERKDFNSYGVAARQPRGDGARHVREHPAPEPARPRLGGRRGPCTCPSGEQMTIYDAAERYRREGIAARRHRGQGVRHRLVARLGGEGPEAARRARRDRRELRAHPPLEPAGWASCRCSSCRARAASRSGSPAGGVLDRRPRERRGARGDRARGRRRSSARSCGSTRRASASTCATAASCRTCCGAARGLGALPADEDRPAEVRRARGGGSCRL